jgi:hypothetical protein
MWVAGLNHSFKQSKKVGPSLKVHQHLPFQDLLIIQQKIKLKKLTK